MRLIDADAFERKVMFGDEEDLQDVIYALRDFPTFDNAEYDKQIKAELLDKVKTEIENWQGEFHDNDYDADEFDFVFERVFDIIAELKAEVEK